MHLMYDQKQSLCTNRSQEQNRVKDDFQNKVKDLACQKIGLDHPRKVLFIMHEPKTCPGVVGQWFLQNGYQIEVKKPRWGDQLPETLRDYCGVVIFGGNMSVNDPLDYIKTEIDWLKVPLGEDKPLLGICLGAQLLVKYLGGDVLPHKEGVIEAGYYPVYPTSDCILKSGSFLPEMIYEWHREGFEVLPSGLKCFLKGLTFENQAVLHGQNQVGLQFHPEVTEEIIRRWISLFPDMLREKGSHSAQKQIWDHLHHHKKSCVWLDGFLSAWCDRVLV